MRLSFFERPRSLRAPAGRSNVSSDGQLRLYESGTSLTRTMRLVGFALAVFGCANQAKTAPESSASVKSPPAPSTTRAEPWPAATTETPSAAPSPSNVPAPPSTGLAAGGLETHLEGCLARAPSDSETPTRAFFRPRPDRATLTVEDGKVRFTHELTHACCLKAATRLERDGTTLTLIEQLSGRPCRCRCSSVIRSDLPLSSGEYELRVRLEQASEAREVHRQTLRIP